MATRTQRILIVLAVIASSALAEIVILHPVATWSFTRADDPSLGTAAAAAAKALGGTDLPLPASQDVSFPWAPGIVATAALAIVILVAAGFGTWADELRRLLCLQAAAIALGATAIVVTAIFELRSARTAQGLIRVEVLPSGFGALTAGCCATALALLATRASAGTDARGVVAAAEPVAPGPHEARDEEPGEAPDGATGAVATPRGA